MWFLRVEIKIDKAFSFFMLSTMALTFDPETHTYIQDGVSLISVTTFISTLFKKFNPAVTIAGMKRSPNWPQSKYYGMTDDDIKSLWARDGELACRLGTELHAWIEDYYVTGNTNHDSVEFLQFLEFANEAKLVRPLNEFRVSSVKFRVAGTVDCVSHNEDGTVDVYDWKRCKDMNTSYGYSIHPLLSHIPSSNFWKYSIQLNLYRILIEESGMKVREMYIVCFHPEHLGYQKYNVAKMDLETILNERK